MGLTVVGIDNGLNGGIALLNKSGIKAMWKMPISECGKRINSVGFSIILAVLPRDSIVAIEAVPDHMDSAHIMRSIAINYGILLSAAEIAGFRVIDVPSGNKLIGWQRNMLGKVEKGKTKEAAELKAKALWPDLAWPTLRPTGKKIHDGIVDACLIGEFVRLNLEAS